MNQQQSQARPRIAGGVVALPASSYWRHIVPLAILMTAVIGARAHEGIPLVSKLRPALVLGVFGGGFALMHTRRAVIMRAASDPVFRSVAMYVAWAALTVPFAMWAGGALASFQGLLPALALSLVIQLCPPTREAVDRLQRGFVLACSATALSAKVLGNINTEGRLNSAGSLDSNDLAAVMAMAVPLALGLMSRERRTSRKALWAVCTALLVYILMAAGSRGGLIAIMVSALCFIAGQRGTRKLVFAGACAFGAFAAWNVGSAKFQRKVIAMFHGEQDYNYTSYFGRKQVWARARVYTLEHPLLGVGIGNFPVAEGENCKRFFPDGGCKWSAPHNSYYQASSELGIPGALLFVGMLLFGARTAYRLWKPQVAHGLRIPELLGALAGYATSAVFLSHAYFYLLFALLALIALAARAQREELASAGHVPVPAPTRQGRRALGLPRRPRPAVPVARPAAYAAAGPSHTMARPLGRPMR
jgi:O-antigen ligase